MPYGVIIDVTYNEKNADKHLKSLLKKLEKANKIDLVIDPEKFKKITDEYNKLRAKFEKQPVKVSPDVNDFKRKNREIVKDYETSAKQREDLAKVENSRIKRLKQEELQSAKETNRALNETYKSRLTEEAKLAKELESRYNLERKNEQELIKLQQRRTREQEASANRLARLGQEKGTVTTAQFGDDAQLQRQIKSVYGLNSAITSYQRTIDSSGNAIVKFSVATEEADNQQRVFRGTVDSTSNTIRQSSTEIRTVNSNLVNMSTRLLNTIKQSLAFASTMGLMYKALAKLREGFGFIVEAENQFTQIRAITGLTKDETDALLVSYNKLGQELGITTKELNSIALSLFRQGLSAEQVEERMRAIATTSRVTGADVKQVTDTITAGINGAGLEAQKFADILTLAGSISATSFEEVSAAVNRVIGVSKTAGIETELLVAQVSTLSESLRGLSPETLGVALRSIIARFSKVNEATGEANAELNKVQTAIESVGITFVDSEGQIRPVGELLGELAGKWQGLDKNTKNYLSTQIAGTRQISTFNTLMDKYNRVLELNSELLNANGTVAKQYEVVQDSLGSSLNRLTGAFEELFINTLSSDGLKGLVDFATVMVKIIDKIGVFTVAMTALSFVLLTSNRHFVAFTTSIVTGRGFVDAFITTLGFLGSAFKGLVTGQITLATVMTSLGTVIDVTRIKAIALQATLSLGLAFALQAVISGISFLIGKSSEMIQKNKELDDSISSQTEKYNELTEAQQKNLKARLLALKTEAQQELPALEKRREALQNRIDKLQEQLQSGDTTKVIGYSQGQEYTVDITKELAKELKNLTTEQTELNESIQKYNGYIKDYTTLTGESSEVTGKAEKEREEFIKSIYATYNARKLESDGIREHSAFMKGLINQYNELINKEKDLSSQLSDSTSAIGDYNGILEELDKNHKLSSSTITQIIQQYPELTAAVEDGTFNELKLRELISDGLQKEKEDYINTTNAKLAISETFYSNILSNESETINTLSDQYGVDLKNFTSLEKAKTRILQKFVEERNNYIAQTLSKTTSIEIGEALSRIAGRDTALRDRLDAFNQEIDDIVSRYAPTQIDFTEFESKKTGVDKKKEKEYKTEFDALSIIDAKLKDINNELSKYNQILDPIDTKLKNLGDTEEDNLKRIELLNQKREKELELQQKINESRAELANILDTQYAELGGILDIDVRTANEQDITSRINELFGGEREFGSEAEKQAFTDTFERAKDLLSNIKKIQDEIVDKTNDLTKSSQNVRDIQKDLREIAEKTLETFKKQAKAKLEEAMLEGKTIKDLEKSNKILQARIDGLQKANKLKNEEEDREKRLKAIQEARIKLENIRQQRTVRLFTGEKFEFVADPRAVKQAQDDLNKLVEDNDQKEKEIKRQKEIETLQELIKSNNNLISATKEAYKQIENNLEAFLDKEGSLFKIQGVETNKIVNDTLTELEENYGVGLDAIRDSIAPKISNLISQFQELQAWQLKINALAGGSGGLIPTLPTNITMPTASGLANVGSTNNNNSVNISNLNLTSNNADQFLDGLRRVASGTA